MNILFIGPYKQNDEWGHKSRSLLKALQNTKHNITSRPIFLSNNPNYNTSTISSELNTFETYDIAIQFVLQPYATYIGNVKRNIGIFNYETIPDSIATDLLVAETLMDEIWTESSSVKNGLEKLFKEKNIDTKVTQIPLTLNIDELPKKPSDVKRIPELENRFIFYCMCDLLDDQDAFKETCIAYLNTFTQHDMVALVAFANGYVDDQKIQDLLKDVRSSIGSTSSVHDQALINITAPPPPMGTWSPQDRVNIHNQGDAMVSISHSVSAKSSVLEAAVYQKTPIVNSQNAIYDLLGEENVWGIESYNDTCTYKNRSLNYRFTANELWNITNIKSLGMTMHNCYVNKLERDQKKLSNSKLRQQFEDVDYEKVLNEGNI